ncbi:hypothetical protein DWY71_06745 [Bacteroides sp. AF26-7BH]|nr:hypothetical protein DWY71_06745 [Bacteroides sp. AF26-7BH]
MPKSVSTRSAYKMLTCIYLCRTLLFFAPYADFLIKKELRYNVSISHAHQYPKYHFLLLPSYHLLNQRFHLCYVVAFSNNE